MLISWIDGEPRSTRANMITSPLAPAIEPKFVRSSRPARESEPTIRNVSDSPVASLSTLATSGSVPADSRTWSAFWNVHTTPSTTRLATTRTEITVIFIQRGSRNFGGVGDAGTSELDDVRVPQVPQLTGRDAPAWRYCQAEIARRTDVGSAFP